ncbi:MAG: oligosaccharide repeat unit polymerase [Clostridia bacterium]|nr:oligosaccharide repeat unit polymerase [Clostridia bacterium]
MAILFLAIIVAFILIAYFLGNKDLLSPWFLLCLAIFASYFIVLLNYENWEVSINGTFVLYVTTAVIAFGAGGMVIKALRPLPAAADNGLLKVRVEGYNYKKRYPANLFIIISVLFAALYIYKLLSDAAGDASSFSGKLRAIYEKIVNENYSPGFLANQLKEVITAIAYVNTYRLFLRLYSKTDKISRIKLIIPVVVFLVAVVFSSDRNIFIRYALYAISLFVLFFRENSKKKNVNGKIIQIVIILLLVMVLLFFLMGSLKQYKSDIFRSLSIYGGSGLYNFNLWVDGFHGEYAYGSVTSSTFVKSVNEILQLFGLDFNYTKYPRFDTFITYESANGYVYSSNVYSAFKPYVQDFGYLGVIIFPFVIGLFFEWLFTKMRKAKYGFAWIIYCALIYPIVFFPIAEQIFARFHMGLVYEIGWCAIIYFSVFGRKPKKNDTVKALSEERCDEKR